MTTPGGVPNLPLGALTLDTLASRTQDMSGTAMKSRAVERFPSIMNGSTGLDPALDITPFGILTRIWAEVNSLVANADPADIQGPDDLPPLLLEFIEGLPVVGELVGLLEAILGEYDGDDEVLLQVQEIFAPIRKMMQLISGGVPISWIIEESPQLLPAPLFAAGSIAANPQWSEDAANSRTSDTTGAAKVVADGTMKALRSGVDFDDTILVAAGKKFVPTIYVKHAGYAGSGSPIQLHVVPFTGTVQGTPVMVDSFAPAGADLDWPGHQLTGEYSVPAGVTAVQVRLVVTAAATAGTIWWDDGSAVQTGLLSQDWVDGLPESLQQAAEDVVTLGKTIFTGITHLADNPGDLLTDISDALDNIPGTNVGGPSGMPNVTDTFTTMWDNITSALRLTGFSGVTLDQFADAAQNTSESAVDSYQLSTINTTTLGIRTNNDVMGALERTSVTNIKLSELGTGSTPTNFGVTQAASAIALLRMYQDDTKGVVGWRSSGNASITGFYLNFGKMALDGTVTPLFSSGNLVGQLTSGWQWQEYIFPGVSQIVHTASEVIVVEFQVVGAGTVSIAGLPMAWQTDDHPTATTKRSGATRNTGAGGPTALSNTGFTFTGNTPKVDLGRADVPAGFIPPETATFPNSGTFTYTIPVWARVAGTLIDIIGIGAGGGGGAGGYGAPNRGGRKGNFNSVTLVYGVDIPLGTTTITGNVAGSASPGINPFTLDSGSPGGSTTIVVPGYGTITCTGGAGGSIGGTGGQTGEAAGNRTQGTLQAFGGAEAGVNQAGNAPGGGGGSGYPATGQPSGKGKVWFKVRQP